MTILLSDRTKNRYGWATRTPFFYGWVIVALGALAMFFTTPGQSDSFAMFMDSFVDEFGWSRTSISSLYSIATLLSGCLMFFVGRIVDRIGAKWVAILAAFLLGSACLLLSIVVSPVVLFAGFFLARFAGKGALELSATTLAPQWFIKRRAFSIMLVGLGGTAGGIVFPLLNAYLINTFGWRQAYLFLMAGLWLIYIPITFFFLISRPEDAGLTPDANPGASMPLSPPRPAADSVSRHDVEEPSFTQGQAIRTTAFWIIAFCVFQASLVGTGITLHFVSIFKEIGYDMTFAAQIMSTKPLIGFGTVVLVGLILDRIKQQQYVLAFACLAQASSYLLLAFLNSPNWAFIYAIVTGAASAVLGLSLGVLKPNLFGRRFLGGILGVLVAINVIGSAIGPIIFGAVFDRVGGYREVILASALLPLLAGILSLLLRKPQNHARDLP